MKKGNLDVINLVDLQFAAGGEVFTTFIINSLSRNLERVVFGLNLLLDHMKIFFVAYTT